MGNRLFTHFSEQISHVVDIVKRSYDGLYHLKDSIIDIRSALNNADRIRQLTDGEQKMFERCLDEKFFAT